jgi:hypothetical protein
MECDVHKDVETRIAKFFLKKEKKLLKVMECEAYDCCK